MYKTKNIKYKKNLIAVAYFFNKTPAQRINFLTKKNLFFQIAQMHHPKNHVIKKHYHKKFLAKVNKYSEFLLILNGKIKVNFFTKKNKKIISIVLKKNDMLLIFDQAHEFKVLEKVNMIEVKQGPFNPNNYKVLLK